MPQGAVLPQATLLLKKLYEIYCDFALKNPFYSLDMPIRYTDILSIFTVIIMT